MASEEEIEYSVKTANEINPDASVMTVSAKIGIDPELIADLLKCLK